MHCLSVLKCKCKYIVCLHTLLGAEGERGREGGSRGRDMAGGDSEEQEEEGTTYLSPTQITTMHKVVLTCINKGGGGRKEGEKEKVGRGEWRKWRPCSLVPRPHPLTRRNDLVNQVEFLGLVHAFATM